jgi:hypothetical protein
MRDLPQWQLEADGCVVVSPTTLSQAIHYGLPFREQGQDVEGGALTLRGVGHGGDFSVGVGQPDVV